MSKPVVSLTMAEAKKLGIVVCVNCGYPPNNHFANGKCAHEASCPGYSPKFKTGKTLLDAKPEKEWVLVRFTDNWADEFNVDAMAVLPANEWETRKASLRAEYPEGTNRTNYQGKKVFEADFGTNQSIEYENVDAYLARFVVKPVPAEWAKTFDRLCAPKPVVGVLPYKWLF